MHCSLRTSCQRTMVGCIERKMNMQFALHSETSLYIEWMVELIGSPAPTQLDLERYLTLPNARLKLRNINNIQIGTYRGKHTEREGEKEKKREKKRKKKTNPQFNKFLGSMLNKMDPRRSQDLKMKFLNCARKGFKEMLNLRYHLIQTIYTKISLNLDACHICGDACNHTAYIFQSHYKTYRRRHLQIVFRHSSFYIKFLSRISFLITSPLLHHSHYYNQNI